MLIYLDNNATTTVAPEVLKITKEALKKYFANPSSIHSEGKKAKSLLVEARSSISSFFKVSPQELLFTSGGTESINTAIRGYLTTLSSGHIITTDIEHAAVYKTLLTFSKEFEIEFLKVGLYGAATSEMVKAAIRPNTKLILLSAANSETGVKTDIESIGAIAEETAIPFIIDGVAILGKELFKIPKGCSAICFSGHKIHAPKGIGLLYLNQDFKIKPLITGGPQEFEKRAGTENLAFILAFKEALNLINEEGISKMRTLRDYLENRLKPYTKVNGTGPRISNTSNLSFHGGIDGETLLIHLDRNKIAASLGSACSAGLIEPSRILLNMGIKREEVKSSIRFSLSRYTTKEEIDKTVEVIQEFLEQ